MSEKKTPKQTVNGRQQGGITRHFFREFNRVMTRGFIEIHPRQQPDSPRERIRSQIIIAIVLIALFIGFVLSILEAFKK
jgi:hypothetical protein